MTRCAAWCDAIGSLLLIAGPAIVVGAGLAPLGRVGSCLDFTGQQTIRSSIGASLPIPLVQLCPGALPLYLSFYFGYIIALAGMLLLFFGRMRLQLLIIVAVIVSAISILVPFVFSTDPYAYAFYAFEMFVRHVSPYVSHRLPAIGPVLRPLITLFPNEHEAVRIANYGPVFIGTYGALIGPFSALSLRAMIIAERVTDAALLLATALLLSQTRATNRGRRFLFIAIALNPLLIFESISFAHGDILMLAFLAGAYFAYLRGRFSVASVLCVFGAETRAVGALALIVLLVDLWAKRGMPAALRSAAIAAGVILATAAASLAFFGTFTLGNAPTLTPGSPIVIVFELFRLRSFPIGVSLQAATGLVAIYIALRHRVFRLVAPAALAALPVVRAWYLQWLVPVAALSEDRALQAATIVVVALAPITELPEVLARGELRVWAVIVSVQWVLPIGAYFLVRKMLSGQYSRV